MCEYKLIILEVKYDWQLQQNDAQIGLRFSFCNIGCNVALTLDFTQ